MTVAVVFLCALCVSLMLVLYWVVDKCAALQFGLRVIQHELSPIQVAVVEQAWGAYLRGEKHCHEHKLPRPDGRHEEIERAYGVLSNRSVTEASPAAERRKSPSILDLMGWLR